MARRISNARLAAPGRSALAASNQAETRAWSMASSRSFPKAGAQVDVVGLERGGLPPEPASRAVADGEFPEHGREPLARGLDGVNTGVTFPSCGR